MESSGYTLAALGIADPAEPGFLYTAEAGKRLVAVEVLLSNNSGELLRVNPLYAELLDSDGFVYQAELGGSAEQIGVVELLPGEKVRGWIAFKAPDAATLKSLRYALDVFGAQTLQVELTAAPEGHVAVAGTTSALTSLPAAKWARRWRTSACRSRLRCWKIHRAGHPLHAESGQPAGGGRSGAGQRQRREAQRQPAQFLPGG